LKKELSGAGRAQWQSKETFQQPLADYFAKHPNDTTELAKYLQATSYHGNTKKFLEDLKAGKVNNDDLDKMYLAMGITPSVGFGEAKAPTAGKAAAAELGGLTPDQKALFDPKKQDDLKKKHIISKEEADQLAKDKKTLDPSSKATKEEKEAAKKRVEDIAKRVAAYEDSSGAIANTLKVTVANATVGTPKKENVDQVNAALDAQIAKLYGKPVDDAAKQTDEYKLAKDTVLKIAGQQMSQKQKDDLVAAGGAGTLIAEVPVGGTPAAPPPKTPTGGATGGGGQKKPAAPPPQKKPDDKGAAGPPPNPNPAVSAPKPPGYAPNASGQVVEHDGVKWISDDAGNWTRQ
jgi:hypothetical protein